MMALQMWRTAFGGSNDFGVGSAIAVLIFLFVIPILAINIRRFREGGQWQRLRLSSLPPPRSRRRGCASCFHLSKLPVQILLVLVGLLWLVPTFGLLVSSLLSPRDFIQEGWWQVFTDPGKLTWENYDVLTTTRSCPRSWTTVLIAVGGTILPIIVAALAGYAFAWLEFPGRDWLFILVIALLVVPIQMALSRCSLSTATSASSTRC